MDTVLPEMLSAGIGCSIADCALNWLDLVKTKQQLDCRIRPVYPANTWGIIRQCATQDGIVRGLWFPGLPVTVLRSMTYVSVRIGTYPTVKRWISGGAADPSLGCKVLSGALTGGAGSCLFCPLDIVRTRIMADSGTVKVGSNPPTMATGLRRGLPIRYTSTPNALATIWGEEGVRGLYRGAATTVARSAIFSAAQLTSYDCSKTFFKTRLGVDECVPLHVTCSLISGIIGQGVMQPIDTTRSYIMSGAKEANTRGYAAVWEIVQQQGWRWFYRGLTPALMRVGPLMLVQFPIIEQVRILFGLDYL